jgi:hypothetical protein
MARAREYPGAFTEQRYEPSKAKARFRLKLFEGVTMSTVPNYLVKGILPRVGLCIVWGPPKCGKSFWTFDLVMHVALGWQYRGHRVQQGTVVYLALEGGHGFAGRVEAWRRQHLNGHRARVPFYLCDEPIDLVRDQGELIAAIHAQLERRPATIVIDTLNRALIGDENKSDDMAKFIRAADMLRVTFNCLVIIVHHCGVQGSRPRGHTSLSGADDAQIAVERVSGANGAIVTKIEHMKDGDSAAPIASRLKQVELGVDDDGDTITSCVIAPTELPTEGLKLSGATKLAYDSLIAVLAESGEVPPASNHIPAGHRVCSAVLWREHFYRLYVGKPDTKQKAFVRATLKLQEAHLIGIWSDKAWIAGHAGHTQTNGQMSG